MFQLPIIEKFFFDNGKTDAGLLISFSATDLSEERRTTILGFHIFTSKVYASLFFDMEKTCLDKLSESSKLPECFKKLGEEILLKDEIFGVLEENVYLLYLKK